MALARAYGKVPEIYGYQTLHREIGYYISRIEQYEKSVKFFDEAIKKTPDDKRALIGRARARSKVIEYEGALEDVNKALGYDPSDLVVLADKALNTYLCCEFEEGLLQNTRLLPQRKKPDNFSMGVMQCSDAIENCLGERAGRPLRDHFLIIRKMAWERNYAAHKPFEPQPRNKPKKRKKIMLKNLLDLQSEGLKEAPAQPKKLLKLRSKSYLEMDEKGTLDIRESLHSIEPDNEPIPKYSKPFPFRPLQHFTTNIENYMAEKYLDSMYLDKIFLKQLQSAPGAKSPNKDGTKRIYHLAKNCHKTVHYKQELLRTRRPFYFIKYQEATVTGGLKERQKMELEHQQYLTKIEADTLCSKMMEAYTKKQLKTVLHFVEKLKAFCDYKPKKLLPDKDKYMVQVFDTIAKAFYDVYRVNPEHSFFQQKKRIYAVLGIPLSRQPSRDSVVDQFKDTFFDHQRRIEEFSRRLCEATSSEETCWYYHELSRYEYERGRYDLSRLYSKKCIKEAKLILNTTWIFNSAMLMLKNNLADHNKNDARNDLALAVSCAEELGDEEKSDYLTKCQEVVETVEFEDMFGAKQLEKRENKIVQMMTDSKMKDEVAHLFRQMAAMPASRRMTVMPGVRASEKGNKKSLKSRTMSIMPGAKESSDVTRSASGGLKDLLDF
ncbi:unnamed protein product [Ceutorhynchus assimilis]|uniref:Tetratricopeptide repeat protein 25 n=1 Tax=Ceutorhynchus assimilis TaxID=467358 RepID=A0A9P0DNI7_9CUCU|nr:unnamed protein product [Ceutorhynchus assimilis]